jgi:hypothetical protein
MIEVFKVAIYQGGKYCSFCVEESQGQVKYELGKVTYPIIPRSCLFAFESLELAVYFGGNYTSWPIFRCEAELSRVKTRKFPPSFEDHFKFWASKNRPRDFKESIYGMAVGSVYCAWIKPVEIVK